MAEYTRAGRSDLIKRNVAICREALSGVSLKKLGKNHGLNKCTIFFTFHKTCRAANSKLYDECGGKMMKLRSEREVLEQNLLKLERKFES